MYAGMRLGALSCSNIVPLLSLKFFRSQRKNLQ
jgi:uncharacterized protein involved in high-affinity Fe2+ transport